MKSFEDMITREDWERHRESVEGIIKLWNLVSPDKLPEMIVSYDRMADVGRQEEFSAVLESEQFDFLVIALGVLAEPATPAIAAMVMSLAARAYTAGKISIVSKL